MSRREEGGIFTLECGHKGRVVWVGPGQKTICVRGVSRHCRVYGRRSTGDWVPTNYLISVNEIQQGE